jgi:primosomal protein N' (replication factor Y) (superfamily II helicase)
MAGSVAHVILESPIPRLDRLLDYSIPAELEDQVVVGGRVTVPLGKGGSRRLPAFVVAITSSSSAGVALAEVYSASGNVPVLTPALWELARTVADRNGGSVSDVLRVAIPKRTVRTEKGRSVAPRVAPLVRPGDRKVLSLSAGVAETPLGTTRVSLVEVADLVRVTSGGVIVVVPDWRDLALLARALHDVPHVIFDSSGTPTERYERYLSVLTGESRVVIGTRSAVYAPVADLELMVVLDESDPLLEEPHSPYVHARDAAVVRHSIEGGTLVFASTTPSVESARFIELGFVEPSERTPRRTPVVLANDVSDDEFSARARIPSSAWRIVRAALDSGPVLVQVSRPGFSPQVVCTACRTPHRCGACRSLLSGNHEGTVFCRVCGAQPLGLKCGHCGGRDIAWAGVGSVRTADELGRAFPKIPVIVADGEHRTLEVPRRPCLVISTRGAEPIVAGGYQAVLIVDGDKELQRPGLRTSENCLRWWGHAASLAAEEGTLVLANVEGVFATQFGSNQWEDIVATELRERRALGFPPATRAVAVRGTIVDLQKVRELDAVKGHRVIGPAPDKDTFRIVIFADYRAAPSVIAGIRTHVVTSGATSLRVHCDDLSIFDELDDD